ncbi:Uncharacterised protein [Mycobacterium tuberculosis]|nr:Uncharacterised protein [Mycobacterium tuberculosis]
MLDGHPQRAPQQLCMRRQVVLDHTPIDSVVHVVEQVDIGDPDRELVDLRRIIPAARLQIALPAQPINRRGPVQTREEVVGNAGRHLGFPVDVDPERLGFDQAALAAIDTNSHLTPPVGGARAPAPTPQHVAELDRPDKVHHGPADDPQRVGLLEAHLAQLVLTDVLDVPTSRVQPQPARAVDVADAQRPFSVEHVGVTVGHGHQFFVEAHGVLPISSSRVPQAHP